jgi:hypothetical protein
LNVSAFLTQDAERRAWLAERVPRFARYEWRRFLVHTPLLMSRVPAGVSLITVWREPASAHARLLQADMMDMTTRSGVMKMSTRMVIILATCAVALGACSGLTPPARATWAPGSVAGAITTRSASAQNAYGASSYQLTVTARCHADEQLVGGGFEASDVFEYAVFLRASYPANNAWTVKTDSISHYALAVFAYCLRGEPSLETRIVSGEECPAGAALLSHGMTDQGGVTLCAERHVASVSRATTPFTLNATTTGYQPQSAIVVCPAGAIALDGGATVGLALVSKAGDGFRRWEVVAGGDGAGAVYANCITFV